MSIRHIIDTEGKLLCKYHKDDLPVPAGMTSTTTPPPTDNHRYKNGQWQYFGQLEHPVDPTLYDSFRFQNSIVLINNLPFTVTTPLTEYDRIVLVDNELIGYVRGEQEIVTGSIIVDLALDEMNSLHPGLSFKSKRKQ